VHAVDGSGGFGAGAGTATTVPVTDVIPDWAERIRTSGPSLVLPGRSEIARDLRVTGGSVGR